MPMQASQLYNLIIREWLNGALLPLSVALAIIISIFLAETWWKHGRGWTGLPGIAVSCAFWWLFTAESIRAGVVWVLLRIQNDGQKVTAALDWYVNIAFILGATLLILAFLRCIYLFTPTRWGHRYWIASLFVTIVFLALSEFFPPFPLPLK